MKESFSYYHMSSLPDYYDQELTLGILYNHNTPPIQKVVHKDQAVEYNTT